MSKCFDWDPIDWWRVTDETGATILTTDSLEEAEIEQANTSGLTHIQQLHKRVQTEWRETCPIAT